MIEERSLTAYLSKSTDVASTQSEEQVAESILKRGFLIVSLKS